MIFLLRQINALFNSVLKRACELNAFIGLAKKFIQVFPSAEWRNLKDIFGQLNIIFTLQKKKQPWEI